MKAMQLRHIARYTRPPHFIDLADFDRTEYFVIYARHRDSDSVTESNFRAILRQLGGESDTVLVVRDRHDLVGWIESIYVHESDTERLQLADDLIGQIADYPILDEDDWSALEYERAADYWAYLSLVDRIDWCRRYGVSIFAARRDDPPSQLIAALAQ